MQTEEITSRVDTAAAKGYRAASEEDRRKLDLSLSFRLHDAGNKADYYKGVNAVHQPQSPNTRADT
jgi:hypothetical protein